MVKKECEAKANSMLDYYTDLITLWEGVTDLDRGKGNAFNLADNVQSFIMDTHSGTFGSDHHSELVTNLEDVRDALRKGNINKAREKVGQIFVRMPKIVTDVISECECGEFLVKI